MSEFLRELTDRSVNSNGYQRLPGGLIIQWGSGITAPTGVGTANFPVPFPNACLFAAALDMEDSAPNVCYAGMKWTATQVIATFAKNGAAADAVTWSWFAIGF